MIIKIPTIKANSSYLSVLEYCNITIDNFKSPAHSTAANPQHVYVRRAEHQNAKGTARTGQPSHDHTYSLVSVIVQVHGTCQPASQHTHISQKSLTRNTIERVTTQYETEQSGEKNPTLLYEYCNTDTREARQERSVCFAPSVQV